MREKREYTEWINEILKNSTTNRHVDNLETDLDDGVILIKLLEVLSPEKSKKLMERYITIETQLT